MNFLFWNTQGVNLASQVARLASDCDADFVILAEAIKGEASYLAELNIARKTIFRKAPTIGYANSRVSVFSRLTAPIIQPLHLHDHWTAHAIVQPGKDEFILACVHLNSLMNQSERSLADLAMRVAGAIHRIEDQRKHRRTVVIGDFNMNPFHHGMVSSESFHAVMDRRIALKKSRYVSREERFFFYNPMWGKMGDTSSGPCGTYHASGGSDCQFWHVFDQVLIRPELIAKFTEKDVNILNLAGSDSLVTRAGLPNKRKFSDHLPIHFKLHL